MQKGAVTKRRCLKMQGFMSQTLVQRSHHVPLLQGLDVVSSIEHACQAQPGLAQRDSNNLCR